MYILAPKMYILTRKMYLLAHEMDKSLLFEKVQPQWQLLYLFFWEYIRKTVGEKSLLPARFWSVHSLSHKMNAHFRMWSDRLINFKSSYGQRVTVIFVYNVVSFWCDILHRSHDNNNVRFLFILPIFILLIPSPSRSLSPPTHSPSPNRTLPCLQSPDYWSPSPVSHHPHELFKALTLIAVTCLVPSFHGSQTPYLLPGLQRPIHLPRTTANSSATEKRTLITS